VISLSILVAISWLLAFIAQMLLSNTPSLAPGVVFHSGFAHGKISPFEAFSAPVA
jgi:hypothetical protein